MFSSSCCEHCRRYKGEDQRLSYWVLPQKNSRNPVDTQTNKRRNVVQAGVRMRGTRLHAPRKKSILQISIEPKKNKTQPLAEGAK